MAETVVIEAVVKDPEKMGNVMLRLLMYYDKKENRFVDHALSIVIMMIVMILQQMMTKK